MLRNPPEWARNANTRELLLSVPKVGRVKADRAFRRAQVPVSRTLGELTARQWAELLAQLEGRA